MHKIDGKNATEDGRFQEYNPSTGQGATYLTAEWLNTVQGELMAFLEGQGVDPNKDDSAQVYKIVLDMFQSGLTGGAPVYASTTQGLSATPEGGYFSVPSGEPGESLILYRHDSGGVATEVARTPSSYGVLTAEAVAVAASEAAEAQADRSEIEADRSEAARDAAQLSAGVFPDTAAGLAGTSDGDYFSVPGDGEDDFLTLYRNTSGSSVVVDTYPSAAAVRKRPLAVPDIAALRALTGVQDGQAVYLEADSKGGAGTYVIDTASAAPESLPNVVVLNDGARAVKERTGFLHAKSGKRYQIVDCVIRQTAPGEGWEFIDDAGHSPTGVSSIAVDGSGNLLLGFNFTAAKVGSLVAVPDEFYAAQGMIIGASVGFSTATIKGVADMSALITPVGVAFTGSLGFADDVTVDHNAAAGSVQFTHAPTYALGNSTGQAVSVQMIEVTGQQPGGGVSVEGLAANGFTVQRVTPCTGVVSMMGGVASVSSLGEGVTASWNATDECIDVVHPETVSLDRSPVVGPMIRNPDTDTPYTYLAEFTSSATTIKVHVYAPDGTKITDPADNSIRFSFYRPSVLLDRPISGSDNTRFSVLRKNVPLNFGNVFANSGNIWIHGVFEVSD